MKHRYPSLHFDAPARIPMQPDTGEAEVLPPTNLPGSVALAGWAAHRETGTLTVIGVMV